jgi:hypothetical protein
MQHNTLVRDFQNESDGRGGWGETYNSRPKG